MSQPLHLLRYYFNQMHPHSLSLLDERNAFAFAMAFLLKNNVEVLTAEAKHVVVPLSFYCAVI
jgi:hypothetical protein